MPLPTHHIGLVALAAAVGFIWGLSEIVSMFRFDTRHALRTGGAWLLLLINAAAAGGIYLFVASLIPGLDKWYAALLIGVAWPTVIRNANIKLAATTPDPTSLNPSGDREAAAIRFEQIYANFQNLARQMTNAALTRQRVQLVTRAAQLDLAQLESHARTLQRAAPLRSNDALNDDYIDEIMQRAQDADEIKKVALAVYIIENFGREALEEFMRRHRRQRRPNPSTSP
ncbi:MAG: hypothetical protein ACFLMY_04465 [Candidatus Brachytrichaceae bacterium NZ_4S206]|jgi:hypothetical protein